MARPPNRPTASPHQPSPFDRALAAHQQGRLAEAEQLYAQVPSSEGNYAMALHHLGLIRHQVGDHAGALPLVQQSLRLHPNISPWMSNLASILNSLGRPDEAMATCDRALTLDPKNANAWANRGATLRALGQHDLAIESLERALQLAPQNATAWTDHGRALYDKGFLEGALASLEKAVALNPSQRVAAILAMFIVQRMCQWNGIDQRWRHELDMACVTADAIAGFLMLSNPYLSARNLADGLSEWTSSAFRHITPAPFLPRISSQRLRIAYLSGDFRENVITFLMAGVFEQHNRERFEVTAVAFKPIPSSPMGNRLISAFERVIDVHDRSDDEVVALMRDLNIDIAIDLTGHTTNHRFGIFARRSAPIQVNYLGFPGTSGAPFMDYIIGDRWVTPLDQADTFSEKIVLMPESFQANDDQRRIAPETPSRAALGFPESGFVFCCLNNSYKITPMMFDIWMRLLSQVPGSVLWLLSEAKTVENNLRTEARARGVDPGRLVFSQRVPYEQYLAQYRQADLFLDTLPFNAGTTASDALWAGLPVLTQLGQTFAGRMAASLLDAVGLPELITRSAQEYEQLALKLATEPDLLRGYRQRLAANLPTTPLFDTGRFTRHLETAYQMMWQRHEQGLAPDHIVVPALPVTVKAAAPSA